jgi:hypothetical protein
MSLTTRTAHARAIVTGAVAGRTDGQRGEPTEPTWRNRALSMARRRMWRYGFVIQQSPYGRWDDPETLRRNAREIIARHEGQTAEDVIRLQARYAEPVLGEVTPYHLLELLAQVLDPVNAVLGATSQLAHTLQALELMERDGVEEDLLLAMLLHDVGKLALLRGELPEHVEGLGRGPIGEHEPGIGLDQCLLRYGHGEILHQRLGAHLPEHLDWAIRYHDIAVGECRPFFDARDREWFERWHRPLRRYDASYTAFRLPGVALERYRGLLERRLPATVLF